MSTDDSISEDVSSSVALSHDRISPGGEKESETSEDTVSASNPVQALEGSAAPTSDIPNKIRNLEEAFGSGRTLPFINPSSIETLRVLVREIQSSGETDPEIWKNCEGRWLHLFQLVEKQYQEQILAQQDQYQCQIQLIQDEIKALVQLQNRQISAQSHASNSLKLPPESRTPGPPSPPQLSLQPHESSEDGMMTVLSSGYGTLSIYDHGLETGRSGSGEGLWSLNQQDGSLTPSPVPLTSTLTDTLHTTAAVSPDLLSEKKRAMISQPLTSWAQRPKHRKSRTTQIQALEAEKTVQASSEDKSRVHACSEAAVSRLALNRSDSVASEASGFSYWKLEESELYRPLPESLDTASFALQQPSSLKEIYQRKRPQVQPRPSSTGSTVDLVSHASSLSAAEATLTVRPNTPSAQQAEDPIVLSLLRQRLREKHARHMTDLRTYYEAEISALKERLRLVHLPVDLEKSNRILQERCQQLEQTLTETSTRIRELEERNHHLEKQLAEWPARYEAMSASVRVLQRHAEESQHSGREKDSTISKLKMRVRELEQALQKACREVEEKERVMLQDLLREYDLLRTEHEGTKDKLKATENKLLDADEQSSELKRLVVKLETQIRQLQHDNLPRTQRQSPHRRSQPSGAGLFHHPDLLHSPSIRQQDVDSGVRNGVCQASERSVRGYWTPSERTSPCENPRRDAPLSPSVKTLIQMEDSRATQGRAISRSDCMSSSLARRTPSVLMEEGSGGTLRARRSVSPEGHRSSSVPPRSQKSPAALTPTKRDTLLSPHSARSSPKRCPSENFSTALGRPLPSHEHLQKSPATRRRLHFTSPDTEKDEREEQEVADEDFLSQSPALHSLADAERLFDELTQEKQQIEAALRRLPGGGAGARVTLQSRLDQVSLEKRLETVNRNLGFIRMTLKRFNVLRSSARM